MFVDKIDWLGLIVFGWYTVSIGINCITTAKSDKNIDLVNWGGWAWLPVYALQSLSVFLVWRTNARNDVPVYETAIAFYLVSLLFELGVVTVLHKSVKKNLTAIAALINVFLCICCVSLFFNEHHWAALCYLTGIPRVGFITLRALSRVNYKQITLPSSSAQSVVLATGPVVMVGSDTLDAAHGL